MQSGIKSEPDMLRLRQPSAKRHGGTPNGRMRRREVAKMNTKYDNALSQFPGGIIVVRCDTCGVDYDVRVVSNEVQLSGANHVIFFDCPKGHHCEARRLWKESQEQEKSELAELYAEVRADLDRANDEFLALALKYGLDPSKYGFDETISEILWLKKNVDAATFEARAKTETIKRGVGAPFENRAREPNQVERGD
jgi:hypothetical protein